MFTEKQEGVASESGYYEHKETGAVVHLQNDPEYGTPLTNAYVKAGFVYVGDTAPAPKKAKEAPVKEATEAPREADKVVEAKEAPVKDDAKASDTKK